MERVVSIELFLVVVFRSVCLSACSVQGFFCPMHVVQHSMKSMLLNAVHEVVVMDDGWFGSGEWFSLSFYVDPPAILFISQ